MCIRDRLTGALLMDALVLNGPATQAPIVHSRVFRFELAPTGLRTLDGAHAWTPTGFAASVGDAPLDAVAGIGAPQRFFDTLASLGLRARPHPLADHARIDPAWLAALRAQCDARAPDFSPDAEAASLRAIVARLLAGTRAGR